MELISAKEARDKVREVRELKLAQEFKGIVEAINKAIDENKTNTVVPINISLASKGRLEEKGYVVTPRQTGINEYGTEISWG